MTRLLTTALYLADTGLPVLPLRAGKLPLGNCPACAGNACGGRPHMKAHGPCTCPAPCHGWAAATTDPTVLTSAEWAAGWREARAVGYHPGGAGLTVLDLDSAQAVAWARATLPPTRTVATPRGQHWIYQGVMRSPNSVRPGVDIKSLAAYARWLAPGTGALVPLPARVRGLARNEETTPGPGGARVVSSTPLPGTSPEHRGCCHTDRYLHTGLNRGLATIRARTQSGAASQAYGVARFLAAQHTHCPGPCDLATLTEQLTAAATDVGVPYPCALRAVTNGLAAGLGHRA